MQVSESEVYVCSKGCKKLISFVMVLFCQKNKYLRFLGKPALVL